jgi:uridine phosphorylase
LPEIHTELDADYLEGNQGRGRIIFIPGSAGRARKIYEHFDVQEKVLKTERSELTSYFGQLEDGERTVDVCALATGMGCPTVNIVLGELIKLGGKEFIRVGSAGSLRKYIRVGDSVIVKDAYKDEGTSSNYLPPNWPARAHPHAVRAAEIAAEKLGFELDKREHPKAHIVTGHCKDDLWEEGFPEEYRKTRNPYRKERIEKIMADVMANCQSTSMEEAVLFILAEDAGIAELVNQGYLQWDDVLQQEGDKWLIHPPDHEGYWNRMGYKTVAINAIVGDENPYSELERMKEAEENAIKIAIQTARELYKIDTEIQTGK